MQIKEPIIGNKIILRTLRKEDSEFFTHWYNNPEIMFECGFHEPTTLKAVQSRILKPEDDDEDWYAITDMSGRLIGKTGLLRMWPHWHCTDMSMIIPDPQDQNKGYGIEAGHLMLNRAFQHYNMNRVSVGVVGLNIQSIKYWEKLGFTKEGIQEQGYFYDGEFSDFIMMRLLRNEYIYIRKV